MNIRNCWNSITEYEYIKNP